MRTIKLRAYIKPFKSKNDAHHYNCIAFVIDGVDANTHEFIFNEMQADAISFYTNNPSNYINEDISERIINILCGHKPVTLSYAYYAYGSVLMDSPVRFGTAQLEISGCPTLRKKLKVMQDRKIVAEKELAGRK